MENQRGFTIIEMITVVILLGVIAAFAIPNYRTSALRATEKSMAYNLEIISDAMHLYLVKEDTFPNDANFLKDLATINTNLNVYIISADGESYACSFPVLGDIQYHCTATHVNPSFVLSVGYAGGALTAEKDPHCEAAGACPQCAVEASGGCPY